MISIFVHLWCAPNRAAEFRAYEDAALEIFARYNGQVVEILRPDAALSSAPAPYEIHHLQIASLEAWRAFRADEQLQAMAPQRAACIAQTQIFLCCDGGSLP